MTRSVPSNLRDAGFRFLVSKDRGRAKWSHPGEILDNGWIDCTDMDDEEFDAWMTQPSNAVGQEGAKAAKP